MFITLGTNWGPTDRVLFMQIHLVKILLLRGKQHLIPTTFYTPLLVAYACTCAYVLR